jgi:prophage DNA circulation protein
MTWENSLLPASYRDIEFDILSVDDDATRALARHSYPYTDGADIEDMGREARRSSVRAIFFGDDYEERLQAFLKALDQPGAGVLVHPVFGVMEQMQVSTYRVSHTAEVPDSCNINIDFEESVTALPFFDRDLASQKADEVDSAADDVESANADTLATETGKLEASADAGSMSALSRISAMRQQAVGLLLSVKNEFNTVLTSITDPIRNILGFVADVTSMAQQIVDLAPNELEFLQNFALSNFQKVDRLFTLPVVSGLNTIGSSVPLAAPAGYQAWAATNAATAVTPIVNLASLSTNYIPPSSVYPVSQDQALADKQVLTTYLAVQRAVLKSRILANVLASEVTTPNLTPRQVEQLVSIVRASVNEAISQIKVRYSLEQARQLTEPLKTLAFKVQESGRSVINARPPLIVRQVASKAPLRLLAHIWYGDQGRALELQRLNNLRKPNMINTGDVLNAYAK